MKRICLLLIGLVVLGCFQISGYSQGARTGDLSRLSWMLGNWKAVQRNKNVHEDWKKVSPQTYEGVGYITLFEGSKRVKDSFRLVSMRTSERLLKPR